MKSAEFVHDFTEWIKSHTSIEALFIEENESQTVLYALTSEKKIFLQNFMIFTGYGETTYCKLFNYNSIPYLEIEFQSGNEVVIEFITEEDNISAHLKTVFDRR